MNSIAYDYTIHNFALKGNQHNWSFSKNCSNAKNNVGRKYRWYSTSKFALNANFSRSIMCNILEGKNLVIAGDSLSDQFYVTLLHMMWTGSDTYLPATVFDGYTPTTVYINCSSSQSFNLTYIRSYHLNTNIKRRLSPDVEKPWINSIAAGTVLLLNRGVHYTPSTPFISQLNNTFNEIKSKYIDLINNKKLLVIYRDTHHGVSNYEQLFNTTPSLHTTNYTKLEKSWGWDQFDEENRLSYDLITSKFPWVTYMNISGSTRFRSDSRKDGLHFCIPGPVDSWIMKFIEVVNIWNSYSME